MEMEAGEEPPSPTSSGYDGERGSSATYKADNASEGEIREANADREQHDEAAWLPGKRHVDEVSFDLVARSFSSLYLGFSICFQSVFDRKTYIIFKKKRRTMVLCRGERGRNISSF